MVRARYDEPVWGDARRATLEEGGALEIGQTPAAAPPSGRRGLLAIAPVPFC